MSVVGGDRALGIITSGIAFQHVREASPGAKVLKLGLTHPLPLASMRAFAASVERCLVVEEGDPFLYEAARRGRHRASRGSRTSTVSAS